MDVKITFLSRYLEEQVYMTQPKGFQNPDSPRNLYKFYKSIYTLKQALGFEIFV